MSQAWLKLEVYTLYRLRVRYRSGRVGASGEGLGRCGVFPSPPGPLRRRSRVC